MKGFYITTAIDYVNGEPHLGHAYEKIGADVMARFKRLQAQNTLFLMGTDEHSLNVLQSAHTSGLSPITYCDKMAQTFKSVYDGLNISYDRFVRTTSPQHQRVVQRFIQKAFDKGYIYEGEYAGWYCQSCEAFLDEVDLTEGKCPVHPTREVSWVKEANYFFALSKFQDRLIQHIQDHPQFILPQFRQNEIVNRLKESLRDVSISRSTVAWGVPLPLDDRQVVYVWVDALISYISGIDADENHWPKWWPADYHIIGKDIMWFHCVIWPAFLMAIDIPLPHTVFAHGFIRNSDGTRLSKSSGVTIDPVALSETYGVDTLRYYLMKAFQWGPDNNFSIKELENTYNSDLANDYGNLLSRTTAMVEKYFAGTLPLIQETSAPEDGELITQAKQSLASYTLAMEALNFSQALSALCAMIDKANKYIDATTPWILGRERNKQDRLATVLYNLLEVLRLVTIGFTPFIPHAAYQCWEQLGLADTSAELNLLAFTWGLYPPQTPVKRGAPVFPRLG